MRMFWVIGLLVSLLLPVCAHAGSGEGVARVNEILAGIKSDDLLAQVATEALLVNEGADLAPAMNIELWGQVAALATAQAKEATEPEARLIQRRINALDGAIARLTWKITPREVLAQWLGKLTVDGVPFTRQADPISVVDARVTALFPNYRFYLVDFPPYRGGAAPPPQILRRFMVPPPLMRSNIFAIGKDGTVQLLTLVPMPQPVIATAPPAVAPTSFLQFFQQALTAVKTAAAAKEATYAYLRLGEGWYWWNDAPLAFTIDDKEITAQQMAGTPPTFRTNGKAQVVPTHRNAGDFAVTLTFDATGKLITADLTPNLHLAMAPVMLIP